MKIGTSFSHQNTQNMKHQKNTHVVPNGSQGSAKTAGSSRSAKNFETRAAAINKARQIAINNKSELLIHGKDGRIREKNSYGNDPKNIKG